MAACAACSTTILFGGVADGQDRYCNNKCHQRGYLVSVARQIPPETLREHTGAVYRGACPRCGGPGPVEVHTSHRVWSALLLTSWQSNSRMSCRSCGRKGQAGDALFSLVLGWWGFPWGLIMTPIQVGRNIVGMLRSSDSNGPSPELERAVGQAIAAQWVQQQQRPGA
jgi:hypothetical protein